MSDAVRASDGQKGQNLERRRTAGDRDRALARTASRRHWLVTASELSALGYSRPAIDHRLRDGRLFRIHRAVYAVGRRSLTLSGRRLAAVLACGEGALLSHLSAAGQWHLLPSSEALPEVTVPVRRAQRHGVRLHISRTLIADDITELDRIPITSVARTLVDLTGRVRRERLLEALERAYTLRHLDVCELEDAIARNANHRGVRTLRELLAGFDVPAPTRSQLERAALHVIAAAGLPPPQVNAVVAGLCVDLAWPDWRLVVELDGRRFHDTPWAFERDRRRDTILRTAGYEIMRVSHRRLTREPGAVIDDVRALARLSGRPGT